MKIWCIQIPRLNDNLSWGLQEVAHMFEENGCDVELVDYNHLLYKNFYKTEYWDEIDKFGMIGKGKIPVLKIVKLFLNQFLKKVKKEDIIFYSIFSVESREWFLLLNSFFKKRYPHNKIGIGGSGCRYPGETEMQSEWGDRMLKFKLTDTVFLGESSLTIKDYISNNFSLNGKLYNQTTKTYDFPKIGYLPEKFFLNERERIIDPQYGINYIDHFETEGQSRAYVHFTQGCVKKCTFCDVPTNTPNWTMKPAHEVIKEINHYYEMSGITNFVFTDSTINGSDSNFKKFLILFKKWQEDNNIKINWTSQYALKTIKHFDDEHFKLLASTGAYLAVGLDHCSNKILKHMKKLYQWEDIKYFLLKCKEHNVRFKVASWIVGYPTETIEDFLEYEKLFKLIKDHDLDKSVVASHVILPCSVNKNSVLLKYVENKDFESNNWYSMVNGEKLNNGERLRRKEILDKKFLELNLGRWKYDTTVIRGTRIS